MVKGKHIELGFVEEPPGTCQVSTMNFGRFTTKKSTEPTPKAQ